jgi:ADP-ribose pyrophosphatase YjhB (NUDIX family)
MAQKLEKQSNWPPKIPVCVGAVVLRGKRALLVRQAKGQSLEGQWSIPWGMVEPNESLDIAVLREIREEAGVEAKVEGLLGIQNLPQTGWIGIVFLCRYLSGIPISDGGLETDRADFLSLRDMTKLNEPIEDWCEWLVRRVLHGEYCLTPVKVQNPYQPRLAFL